MDSAKKANEIAHLLDREDPSGEVNAELLERELDGFDVETTEALRLEIAELIQDGRDPSDLDQLEIELIHFLTE